jgi:hypothetical protein
MGLSLAYTDADARRLLFWLLGIELAFACVYVVLHIWFGDTRWGPLTPWFDLDAEVSIPAWFSTVQLALVAAVLFLAAANNRQAGRLPSSHLIVAGAGFLFLSADEGAAIHERITGAAKALGFDWLLFEGVHGAWITVYAVVALALFALVARPLLRAARRYPRESRVAAAGAGLFAGGAVGLEILSYKLLRDDTQSVAYKIEVAAEETLEMVGASVMLYAALLLARKVSSSAAIVTPRSGRPRAVAR